MWPLLVDDKGLTFVDEPPREIGEVTAAWTNNGPSGPKIAWHWRVLSPLLGAMLGFVLGLIAFFVIGGIMESRGHRPEAAWFLRALGLGALVGALAGLPSALRKPRILTLFVGRDGCAQIARGKTDVLLFRDVEEMSTKESVMTFHGVRTTAREVHVRRVGKRRRLWYVSKMSDAKGTDPGFQFGNAVLAAYEAFRAK